MLPRPTMGLLPLCFAICLTACAQPRLETRLQIERVTVPAELLACEPQPEPPAGIYTQAAVATFIVDLADAGQDCRERLARIAALQSAPPRGHP